VTAIGRFYLTCQEPVITEVDFFSINRQVVVVGKVGKIAVFSSAISESIEYKWCYIVSINYVGSRLLVARYDHV